MVKNKFLFGSWLVMFMVLLTSCDSGFDAMNENPVELTSIDPVMLLNSAVVNSAMGYNNLQYETIIVRQMINPFSGVGAAGQYNQINRNVASGNWNRHYRQSLKGLTDVIYRTEDDAENSNLYNMARIWRAYSFMVLTDTYGDIPYSEAGKAYLEDGFEFPKYDTQESIYKDLLNELEEASAALNSSNPTVDSDVLYSGDLTKWRRLGNSLLLRAAMRLSKVEPSTAADYVKTAASEGLMQSNEDNAILRHTVDYQNPPGNSLNGGQSDFFYMDSEFITYLKDTDDPRLSSIAVRYVGAEGSTDQIEEFTDRSAGVQIGMPQGYDNTNIHEAAENDNLNSLYEYSQLDRTRMGDPQAPTFYVTYAQTQLLLAEAVQRGWIQGRDADALYKSGIEAHMQQLAEYGEETAIEQSGIDDYVQANKLLQDQELEQINTQYWIASFLNGPEAWANFRRSGYPELEPNPYPGNDLETENFIRRLTYPSSEVSVNNDNLKEATNRQGPDNLESRVWWDVK